MTNKYEMLWQHLEVGPQPGIILGQRKKAHVHFLGLHGM